jgi:hypothetical protein
MESKPIWQSRTLWFNVAIGLLALAEKTVADLGITDGLLVTILTVGNMLLRSITKTAVTVK